MTITPPPTPHRHTKHKIFFVFVFLVASNKLAENKVMMCGFACDDYWFLRHSLNKMLLRNLQAAVVLLRLLVCLLAPQYAHVSLPQIPLNHLHLCLTSCCCCKELPHSAAGTLFFCDFLWLLVLIKKHKCYKFLQCLAFCNQQSKRWR